MSSYPQPFTPSRVWLTGSSGLLGQAVARRLCRSPQTMLLTNRLDLTNHQLIANFIMTKAITDVINCAAYTNVEAAEQKVETAFAVNASAVKNLSETLSRHNGRLIHISTDYVFSGSKTTAYAETDQPQPLNIYGKSKLAGEQFIESSGVRSAIIRTSWLYGSLTHRSFLQKMVNLIRTHKEISVVANQFGTPTFVNDLAGLLVLFLDNPQINGLFHYSHSGTASWHSYALQINNLLSQYTSQKEQVTIHPINSDDYLQKTARPVYSVLSTEKLKKTFPLFTIPYWNERLTEVFPALLTE